MNGVGSVIPIDINDEAVLTILEERTDRLNEEVYYYEKEL